MLARYSLKRLREDVLSVDLIIAELYRLPGWFRKRASDKDGRSCTRVLILDDDGRIDHVDKRQAEPKNERMLVV
jgi:hypothetical protein